jgi:exopolysaccharide production protein ExoQ
MTTSTVTICEPATEFARPITLFDRRLGWTLLLPLLYVTVGGVFSFQSSGESVGGFSPGAVATYDPGILGYVIFPAIAYSVVLWLVKENWRNVASFAAHSKMLTALGLLPICSVVWSQNPPKSLYFGFFCLLGTLFAYCLVICFQPQEIMTFVCRTGLVVCLLSLVIIVVAPKFGVSHGARDPNAWRGIFLDRSAAAKALVFLLSPALLPWGRRISRAQIGYVLLLSLMLVQARAATPIFVLFFYIVFLILLRVCRKLGPRTQIAFLLFSAAICIPIALLVFEYLPEILEMFGRDPSLTGRVPIWIVLWESVLKRPLLGYGYLAFWTGLKGESGAVIHATHWTFGYAHNGYLELVLQLGLVGLAIFMITLLHAIKNAWTCFRMDRTGRYDWYLGLIAITIVYNIDEATVVGASSLLSILYIVACCGLAQAASQLKQDKQREVLYI